MTEEKGKIVLIVGPTCVGKTTLIEALRNKLKNTGVIISTTTRPMRKNEQNGVDYEFISVDDFVKRRNTGEFYEAVERPTGYYGSSRIQVHKLLTEHEVVFGALDVEGCRIVKELEPESLVIFLNPGSILELEKRLQLRGADRSEIAARLKIAEEEMYYADEFDEKVENIDGEFDKTVEKVIIILKNEGIFDK